jgi:hypothetical protein
MARNFWYSCSSSSKWYSSSSTGSGFRIVSSSSSEMSVIGWVDRVRLQIASSPGVNGRLGPPAADTTDRAS